MNAAVERVRKLREILIDKYPELRPISDELLTLALTKSDSKLSSGFNKSQKMNFGSSDYERLEFLGDAILQTVVSEMLFDNFNVATEGQMTDLRSKIVRNSSLICLSKNKNLCDLLISHTKYNDSKHCADVFEALLGAIYYYLKTSQYPNPLRFVVKWLNAEWDFISIMNYLISNPNYSDVCKFLNVYNPNSDKKLEEEKGEQEKEEGKLFEKIYEEEREMDERIRNLEEHINTLIEEERKTLENLATDELLIRYKALGKEIEKRERETYKYKLAKLYQEKNLKTVNYVVLVKGAEGRKYIIGVGCPSKTESGEYTNIKCQKDRRFSQYSLLGIGEGYIRKEAEEMAAEKAYNYLTQNI